MNLRPSTWGPWPILALAISLSSIASAQSSPKPDPVRFEAATLVKGASALNRPMVMQIAPDGRIYYIELAGRLKRVDPKTRVVETIGQLEVMMEMEMGLIGLILDPDFGNNQQLYLQYAPTEGTAARVSRFTLRDGLLDLSSEQVIIEIEEQRQECCHHAGSMAWDATGNLYISTGDNTHPGYSNGYAPTDHRPDRGPFDSQKSSANTKDLRGKILRIKPTATGYEIPTGNLFGARGRYPKIDGHPAIYVMGCRNPWRISVDQATGVLYWGDVGPDSNHDNPNRGPRGHDELNQAKQAGNYGWPYFIADNKPYRRFDFTTKLALEWNDPLRPVNVSPNNTGSALLPPAEPAWIYYPYGAAPDFPAIPKRHGRTACAGPVYRYDPDATWPYRLPKHYDNSLIFYDWQRNFMMSVFLDEESNRRGMDPFLEQVKVKRPIDIKFGPNGELYVLDYGATWNINEDARLLRIDYCADNRPPSAHIHAASPTRGGTPLVVKVTSKGSRDEDGDALRYEWRRRAGGELLSTAATCELQFTEAGIYDVELKVTDAHGSYRTDTLTVRAGNASPSVSFAKPASGFYDPATTRSIEARVEVSDREDTTLSSKLALHTTFRTGRPQASKHSLGLEGVRRSDCLNCHAVDRKIVGPAFTEIARHYRGKPDESKAVAQRILKGSVGIWGEVPMLPHVQHTTDEIKQMVKWIMSLGDDKVRYLDPNTAFVVQVPEAEVAPTIELRASYTDRPIPPLGANESHASVVLRPYLMTAESFSRAHKAKVVGKGRGAFVRATGSGAFLSFQGMNLDGIAKVTCRVSTEQVTGKIELRANSQHGDLITTLHVAKKSGADEWADVTAELDGSVTGIRDLFFVFHFDEQATAGKAGARPPALDLRTIHFHRGK